MLAHKQAIGKISAFILWHAAKTPKANPRPPIELPMTREDIADFLSMASETVSRCLTRLTREDILTFDTAHSARILNFQRLTNYADGE